MQLFLKTKLSSLSAIAGQEVVDSISAPGSHFLKVRSVLVQCDQLRQKSWSSRAVSVWPHVKLSDVNLGTRPRDNQVADEDIKKP